jgi:hypothetical protein
MQPSVLGFVDHTHAATAQLLQNPVMRNGLAEHRIVPRVQDEHRRPEVRGKSTKHLGLRKWENFRHYREMEPHPLRHACGTHMHVMMPRWHTVASLLGQCMVIDGADLHAGLRMMKTYNATHPHARRGHLVRPLQFKP